jgi:tetratricopeptide (TPR) repeat protein
MNTPLRGSAIAILIALATIAEVRGQDTASAAGDKALKEALAALDEASGDTMIRARLWCDVAALRRERGDRAGAVEALGKARSVAESDGQPPIGEWRQIGQELARLGDAKAALELAAAVPTMLENWRGNPRETVLQEAARAAAEAGHIKAAEEIAAVLPDDPARKGVREEIAREAMIRRADGGDSAGAIQVAVKLPTAAETVFALVGRPVLNLAFDDNTHRADGIAPAQLMAGDKPGATKTALSALALLPEVAEARRSSAALAVVRMLSRLDDVAAARKALAEIRPADPKAEVPAQFRRAPELKAKGYLAAAAVRAGRDEAALQLARDFDQPGEKAYILHFTALAQARAGRKAESQTTFAKAVDLVTKAPDPDEGGTTLHNIASAQSAAGDHAGAARTIALQPGGGTIAWVNLATFQAQAGDFAAARKIAADHLTDSRWWSARTLEFVAERQARAGQAAAVREWIGQLDDGLVKAHALFGLARGLYPETAAKKK